MISYELALKLKNAGFPQGIKNGVLFPYASEDIREKVYIPTLLELIEVCGDNLKTLYKFTDEIWEATNEDCTQDQWANWNGLRTRGSTPEEAVSLLWLEINKK